MNTNTTTTSTSTTCNHEHCEVLVIQTAGYCRRHGGEGRLRSERKERKASARRVEATRRRARNTRFDPRGKVRPNQGLARVAREDLERARRDERARVARAVAMAMAENAIREEKEVFRAMREAFEVIGQLPGAYKRLMAAA